MKKTSTQRSGFLSAVCSHRRRGTQRENLASVFNAYNQLEFNFTLRENVYRKLQFRQMFNARIDLPNRMGSDAAVIISVFDLMVCCETDGEASKNANNIEGQHVQNLSNGLFAVKVTSQWIEICDRIGKCRSEFIPFEYRWRKKKSSQTVAQNSSIPPQKSKKREFRSKAHQ